MSQSKLCFILGNKSGSPIRRLWASLISVRTSFWPFNLWRSCKTCTTRVLMWTHFIVMKLMKCPDFWSYIVHGTSGLQKQDENRLRKFKKIWPVLFSLLLEVVYPPWGLESLWNKLQSNKFSFWWSFFFFSAFRLLIAQLTSLSVAKSVAQFLRKFHGHLQPLPIVSTCNGPEFARKPFSTERFTAASQLFLTSSNSKITVWHQINYSSKSEYHNYVYIWWSTLFYSVQFCNQNDVHDMMEGLLC